MLTRAAQPGGPGQAAFRKAIAGDADPAAIAAVAKAYAGECAGREARFIAAPQNWLAQERWKGAAAPTPQAKPAQAPGVWIGLDKPSWREWTAWRRATKGKSPPIDSQGGWRFPTLAPPLCKLRNKAALAYRKKSSI